MINIRLVIRLTISNCEKCYVTILSLAYLQLRQMSDVVHTWGQKTT